MLSSDPSTGNLADPTGKTRFRFMLDWSLLDIHPSRSMVSALPMRAHDSSNTGNVGKFGRTTALTYGYINAIPTIINPESGGGGGGGQFESDAKPHGSTVEHHGAAVGLGHSGSAIMHAPSENWLGLLFSVTRTKAALITRPSTCLFRDIKEVTGLHVIEPAFNPNRWTKRNMSASDWSYAQH
ncbi:hypothetical protein ST47_g4875 [Ascochyta rabiei]|uniref:Uncharacterized protein n=1 Tax=Didymella rabiei TaxID=5454 RepID=A0A163EUI6_DIDRA|nr:hypothetical protein ST47_g4875 [Ascochyta rabiei]